MWLYIRYIWQSMNIAREERQKKIINVDSMDIVARFVILYWVYVTEYKYIKRKKTKIINVD